MKRRAKAQAKRRQRKDDEDTYHLDGLVRAVSEYHGVGPRLTGGDVDADWARAESDGEEAVGGSVATPDQNIVDELGRALGVEQELDDEVRTAGEILGERDAHRWELDRESLEEKPLRKAS